MGDYEYLTELYRFASEHGYKVKNLNVNERCSSKGRYDYVELVLIIPRKEARSTTKREDNRE